MDPTEALERILSSLADYTHPDLEEVQAGFQDIASWMAKGGFPPAVSRHDDYIFVVGPKD